MNEIICDLKLLYDAASSQLSRVISATPKWTAVYRVPVVALIVSVVTITLIIAGAVDWMERELGIVHDGGEVGK